MLGRLSELADDTAAPFDWVEASLVAERIGSEADGGGAPFGGGVHA